MKNIFCSYPSFLLTSPFLRNDEIITLIFWPFLNWLIPTGRNDENQSFMMKDGHWTVNLMIEWREYCSGRAPPDTRGYIILWLISVSIMLYCSIVISYQPFAMLIIIFSLTNWLNLQNFWTSTTYIRGYLSNGLRFRCFFLWKRCCVYPLFVKSCPVHHSQNTCCWNTSRQVDHSKLTYHASWS